MSHAALGPQFGEHIAAFRDRYHERGFHDPECAVGQCDSATYHFDSGSGLRPLKTKYYVQEVGMVPPPNPRGFGQVDPGLLEKLRQHPHHGDALPLTNVDLQAPVRASQATVEKRKVDRVPKQKPGLIYSSMPPQASPFEGGVHLYDGHHRVAYAMKRGHTEMPMAVYDPDNPQHVEHGRVVNERIKAVRAPLHEHWGRLVRQYGLFNGPKSIQSPEADVARAAYREHQNHVNAHLERIRHEARTSWQA